MQDLNDIRRQTKAISASGVLGRSRSYGRFLEYLVECTADGRTPKELEIATEVFGRGPDFDPSQDSMVRVYAHNLRQKLDNYYADVGRNETRRLTIPRGEYRVALALADEVPEEAADEVIPAARTPDWRRMLSAAALVLAGVVVGVLIGARDAGNQQSLTRAQQVAVSPVWAGMLDDDTPILVVVGDYYIFAELNESGNVERLVREFTINTSRDLDDFMMYEADLDRRYVDLDLTYLPRASASALRDVLRVLYTADKPVRIVAMSELNVSQLRDNHVLYIGYISALDKLLDFTFAASQLRVGETFDQLQHRDSGELFTSSAGWAGAVRSYRDYGYFSTFAGPGGHQVSVVAGMRDTGLMHVAYALTDPTQVDALEQSLGLGADARPGFELLYEVMGVERANLDGSLVHIARFDQQPIRGGDMANSNPGSSSR